MIYSKWPNGLDISPVLICRETMLFVPLVGWGDRGEAVRSLIGFITKEY